MYLANLQMALTILYGTIMILRVTQKVFLYPIQRFWFLLTCLFVYNFVMICRIMPILSILRSLNWIRECVFEFDGHNTCRSIISIFLAAAKQLYEWFSLSVSLSVTPFWLCFHHCIIMKFLKIITIDRSGVHAKDQGQRSKFKVKDIKTQFSRFRTVTPVWIHIWWRNDAQILM